MSTEEIYNEIARVAAECRPDPRYFAQMLAGTMAANPDDERVVAEELLAAARRVRERIGR